MSTGLVALIKRQSGWVVAAASLAAVGGMWIAGFGAEGAPPAKVASVAAPAGPCVNGAGDLGDTYYPGIGNGGYDATHYDLNLKYDPATRILDGKVTMTAAATQHLCRFNLDLRGLTVSSVKVNGNAATFVRDGRELIITPPTPLLPATGFEVEVLYSGEPGPAPRDPDGFLDGWNYTEYGAYTSTPPQGSDTWFPNNNTTNDKAAFTFTVTVPADRQVMSNGLLVSNTINEEAGTSTWIWDAPDPMASYLATLQIGKYTIQRSTTASGIPIINGIRPDQLTALAQTRLNTIGPILDFFGEKFGPYPFVATGAIVDLVNAGYQMEQQTRPIFTSANGLSALAHELAHQWWGDDVAMRRARDVWLSEGFATFSAWMWTENTGGTTAQAAFNTQYARAANTTFWNNTVHDPGVVNQYQSATVYQRGAMTLQALRRKIGEDAFFRTLKAFQVTFGGDVAETADFIAIAQRESGQDLRDFFKQWLYTPGKPSESYCYCLTPPATPGNVGGTVPSTLSLTLGAPAAFGAFTPAVAKDYLATTPATVTSTGGDATLSVADTSTTAPGHLVNGAFSLPQALQARATNTLNPATTFAPLGAAPSTLLTWAAPISNDNVALEFKQPIAATDALRTGAYTKTLTLTLSSTTPYRRAGRAPGRAPHARISLDRPMSSVWRFRPSDMTATYTFDVFSSLDGDPAPPAATGPATGASGAPSRSSTASTCTARSYGWSSEPTRTGPSRGCWPRVPRTPKCATRGSRGCGARRRWWSRGRWKARSIGPTRPS